MPGRVEEDPKSIAWLMIGLGGAELEHCSLGLVEVVDVHVNVHLLRDHLSRPLWRSVGINPLEAQRVAVIGADRTPVGVVLFDLPAEQGTVELGQCFGVGAVEDNDWEASDSHDRELRADSGRKASGVRRTLNEFRWL